MVRTGDGPAILHAAGFRDQAKGVKNILLALARSHKQHCKTSSSEARQFAGLFSVVTNFLLPCD
jgi:hypothetical protein